MLDRVEKVVARELEKAGRFRLDSCDSKAGYHWSGSLRSGSCVENQCTCAGEVGATGTACPINGEELCTEAQKATCTGSICTASGYWYNGTQAKCASTTC